jgi:hypothetical protein
MKITERGRMLVTTLDFKRIIRELAVSGDNETLVVYVALTLTVSEQNEVQATDKEISDFLSAHRKEIAEVISSVIDVN